MKKMFRDAAVRLNTSPRRLWVAAFLLFSVLGVAWSMATPLIASPDEPAHVIRAAAVARGQFNGQEVMVPHQVGESKVTWAETGVRLPAWYGDLKTVNTCYAFAPEKPANCAPQLGHSEQTALVSTSAGRYNPSYYLMVGWPSLFLSGPPALYAMRIVSALICSALLASAMVSAAEARRRSVMMLSVVVAATPMALFLTGMVNPNSVETAAGILVWSALLPMLMDPKPELLRRQLTRLGVATLLLSNVRPLGLIWFGVAVCFALLVKERYAVRAVLRERTAKYWGAAIVVFGALGVVWSMTHPDHSVLDGMHPYTFASAARVTFNNTGWYIQQMIGYFGWLDTPAPEVTTVVWSGVVLLLLFLGLSQARTREVLALLGLVAAIVALPIIAQSLQASQTGIIWQGRYLLPMAAGLPMLASAVFAKRAPGGRATWLRLVVLAGIGLTLANVAAYYWALRRYTVGMLGPVFLHAAKWLPPGGWLPWMALYAVAAAGLLMLLTIRDHEDDDESAADGSAPRRRRDEPGRRRLVRAG